MLLRDTNVGMAEHLRDGQDIGAVLAAATSRLMAKVSRKVNATLTRQTAAQSPTAFLTGTG